MASEPVIVVEQVRAIARERSRGETRAKGAAVYPPIRVTFESGVVGRLDSSTERDRTWAEVLQSLLDSKQPAYAAIDSETSFITSLLLPRPLLVTDLRPSENGDVEVELEISHARHYLRREHPDFDAMRQALDDARRAGTPMLVTESLDSSAIVDVRPAALASPPRRRK